MIIVITGPTCVGKTELSIKLAKQLNGEIINCDSTQIYKTLNIATAKVTIEEQQKIKHHLIDQKEITEDYTVCDYQKDARQIINQIIKKNKTPILVGGTGLYIKAALYDYKFNQEDVPTSTEFLTNQQLYDKLTKLDPNHNIHINNKKRLQRALEYTINSHQQYSQKEKTNTLLYDTIFIGLTTDRNILYEKINKRVDKMINNGLLEEAKMIYDSNIRTKAVITPIGYKELFPYFENKQTLTECLEKIKQSSRRYAKKQYTWFNNQMQIKWFEVDYNNFNKTIQEVSNYTNEIINKEM